MSFSQKKSCWKGLMEDAVKEFLPRATNNSIPLDTYKR